VSCNQPNSLSNIDSHQNNERLRIAVDVTNSGSVDGKEVVRLNIADLFNFPDEEYLFMLKKFAKISLKKGM